MDGTSERGLQSNGAGAEGRREAAPTPDLRSEEKHEADASADASVVPAGGNGSAGADAAEEGRFETREALAAWCEESTQTRDWQEAVRRWRKFRDAYPADIWGYIKEGIALANLGAGAEGKALLSKAERQFPDEPAVDLAFAEVAMAEKDYPRAATCWAKLRDEHPELPWGFTGTAKVLLETGRLDEAERVIGRLLDAFPDNSSGLVDYAACAARRQQWPEALARWRTVKARYPEILWGHVGEAEALIGLGLYAEARAAMALIGERFPAAGGDLQRLTEKLLGAAQTRIEGFSTDGSDEAEPAALHEAPAPEFERVGAGARPAAAAAALLATSNIDRDFAKIMDGWFDPAFYTTSYSDIASPDVDPVAHFHFFGWKENRDPSPNFCTEHYLWSYADARSAGINPLVYHVLVGQSLGHVPAKSAAVPVPDLAAPDIDKVPFDPSAVTVPDPELRRFAFGVNRLLVPASNQYDPASLDIHWVIPDFSPGGGGHMNIFRICNRLEASGHRITLWVHDPQLHNDPAAAKRTLHRHFQPLAGALRFADEGLGDAAGDIIVATDMASVPLVFAAWQFKRRFYFVQDFEAAFSPVGGRYLLAESTYRRELDCICCGPWLERLMSERYGRWARKFWQAADHAVYVPSERGDPTRQLLPRIAFYFRAFTDRRAVELGLLALEILARSGVRFHVDFFGQDKLPFGWVPYSATNHGVCDAAALAQLYQNGDIGLVFSATNYSIVPQEMMACGLPVLDLDGESTRAVYEPGAVRLAAPEPQAIADAIEAMLNDPAGRRAQAERAAAWVSQFSWSHSASLVEAAFADRLGELGFAPATPAVARATQPFATVVIPTLDGGALLRDVIDRVLAQRLPGELQLICIDSASSDGTTEYLASRPEVELIRIARAEFQHGRTRNAGVAAANSEFVAFLTQDALPVDDCWLYNLVCCLLTHPQAGGVFGRHIAYPQTSEFIKHDLVGHFAGFDDLPVCVSLEDPQIRKMFGEIAGRQRLHFYSDNNSCLRKSVWQAVPFPEVEFGEDQLFALELLKQGYGKAYSRHAVVYHSHDESPKVVEERAYTEAKFFYDYFGYRPVRSRADAERRLAGLDQADRRLARERSLPPQQLARRLAQNAARIDGFLRAMLEFRVVQ